MRVASKFSAVWTARLCFATDALAAAMVKGAAWHRPDLRQAPRTAFIFGTVEAITPMIGWALGSVAAKYVTVWDPHGLRELAVRGRQDLRGRRQGRRARDRDHRRKLFRPNGIEFHKASLYVATPKHIKRYDNIEANLDKPPAPVMVFDKLTGEVPHGWNDIRVGPDNKLYVPVGAPRNICAHNDAHMKIMRMNLDGSGVENVATDVRNTVGFDFDPKNSDL